MATNGADKGTMIPVHRSTRDRVAGLRTKELRTYDEVLVRLLEEHDAKAGEIAPSPASPPAVPLGARVVRGVRHLVGKDGETPAEPGRDVEASAIAVGSR